jgi:hypothetical protein
MKGAQLKAAEMVQLHSISSINDVIGKLPHCLSSLKDWEKIKATASNDEVRYSRKGLRWKS